MAASAGVAVQLVACGTPATPTQTSMRPATTSKSATPIAPGASPSPSGPVPTGVTTGTPPVTYSTPPGFGLDLATDQEVQLSSNAGTEHLLFTVDPSAEDVSHPVTTVDVGGETGYVLTRGPSGSGLYAEAVVVRHRGAQYEVACTGFQGYDRNLLEHGCSAFIGSIRFLH